MTTVWEYSPELEAARLLHNAHQIATGFFKLNHFLVLPLEKCPNSDNCVRTPDLPYLSIPRFWERSARLDTSNLPLKIPADLLSETIKLLASANLLKPNYLHLEHLWAKHQNKIMVEIYRLIPSKANSISKIVIWPTVISTSCSFSLHKKTGDIIYIWLRDDQGIASIVEAILTSLTRRDVYDHLGGLWSESEIIVDWLLAYSPLAKLLPSSPKTIKSTRTTQSAQLVQESENYLRHLGAPVISPAQVDTSLFTSHEKDLFNLLLTRSPNVVAFDELSSADPDNFSLFAISKSIQRLRDKLEKSGISGSYIQTKRGEGYSLVN